MNTTLKLLAILLLTFTLASCGPKKSVSTTQAKVFVGALTGFSKPLMLYGGNIEGNQSFSKKILPSDNDITLDLKQGNWKFYALYWDGPTAFKGNLSCFAADKTIEGKDMDVNISLSQTSCNNPDLFPSGIDPLDSFVFTGCSTLSEVTAYSSTCDLRSKGHGESFRLVFPQWSLGEIEGIKNRASAALTSDCINPGTDSGIKLPLGGQNTFFAPQILSYEQSACAGTPITSSSLHTFTKPVNLKTKEFSDGTNNFLFFLDRSAESLELIHSSIGNSCDDKFDMHGLSQGKTTFFGPDSSSGATPYILNEETDTVVSITPSNTGTYNIIRYGSQLIYNSNNGTNGSELWITDGTIPGTYMLADIDVGGSSSYPASFKEYNGTLYFVATTASEGQELWRTDGTAGGTYIVNDLYVGATSGITGGFDNLIVYNNYLYFTAEDGTNGRELYKMDNTETVSLVNDFYPGATGSDPTNKVVLNGKLYFTADDGTNGVELHSFDGSTFVKHTNFTNTYPFSGYIRVFSNNLVFMADAGNALYGTELYYHDGVGATATLLQDLNPGSGSSTGTIYQETSDNHLVVKAFTGSINELYFIASNLTATAIMPGIDITSVEDMITYNGKDYLIMSENSAESALYRYMPSVNLIKKIQGICPSGCTAWPNGKFGISASSRLYIKKLYYDSPDYIFTLLRMGY